MYTRQQYMTNEVSHEQYYGQFVTDYIKRYVLETIGMIRLKKAYAQDVHFNTIPLNEWDILTFVFNPNWHNSYREQLKACGDVYSLSSGVCLLKECARRIVSE